MMSDYCLSSSQKGSMDLILWKDVLLCSPLYQRRMRMDVEDSVEGGGPVDSSSLSPNDSGLSDGSFRCPDTPLQGSDVSGAECPLDVLGQEYSYQAPCFDDFMYSNSSCSSNDFDCIELPDLSFSPSVYFSDHFDSVPNFDVLNTPVTVDSTIKKAGVNVITCDSILQMDDIEQMMSDTEDEKSCESLPLVVDDENEQQKSNYFSPSSELDGMAVSEENDDDRRSINSNDSYLSKLRNDHFKNCDSSDFSDESFVNAVVVKLPPRYSSDSNSSDGSTSIVAMKSQNVTINSQRDAESAMRSTEFRRAFKSTFRNKYVSDDSEDEYRTEIRRKSTRLSRVSTRLSRVSRPSKRASNITLDGNKNAVLARINREKKKAYISSLERQVDDLKSENASMKEASVRARSDADSLVAELDYLKAMLFSQSKLAHLLKNINGDSLSIPILLSSTFAHDRVSKDGNKKRISSEDHEYARSQSDRKYSRVSTTISNAGVCLHVNGERLSLEMCRHCSQQSAARNS